jgi:hypothetical protein
MIMRIGVISAIVILAAFAATGIRSFESVPLESVFETTANASIGDLNGDGIMDIVLAKAGTGRSKTWSFSATGKVTSNRDRRAEFAIVQPTRQMTSGRLSSSLPTRRQWLNL